MPNQQNPTIDHPPGAGAVKFPRNDETMDCPNCGADRAFSLPNPNCVTYDVVDPTKQLMVNNYIDVAFCRSCLKPLVRHRWAYTRAGHRIELNAIVSPVRKTRKDAPQAVRDASSDLAQDYDEAGACEPVSRQAAALLLGRCASEILIQQCGADKAAVLGTQLAAAKKDGKLPPHISEETDGLLTGRNQSAHPWYSPSGKHLKVKQDLVNWCFEVVELMFDHFYVNPAQLAERTERLKDLKDEKKTGDVPRCDD